MKFLIFPLFVAFSIAAPQNHDLDKLFSFLRRNFDLHLTREQGISERDLQFRNHNTNTINYLHYNNDEDECPKGTVLSVDGTCQEPIVERRVFIYSSPQAEKRQKRINKIPVIRNPRIDYNVILINNLDDENNAPFVRSPSSDNSGYVYGQNGLVSVPKEYFSDYYLNNVHNFGNVQTGSSNDILHFLNERIQPWERSDPNSNTNVYFFDNDNADVQEGRSGVSNFEKKIKAFLSSASQNVKQDTQNQYVNHDAQNQNVKHDAQNQNVKRGAQNQNVKRGAQNENVKHDAKNQNVNQQSVSSQSGSSQSGNTLNTATGKLETSSSKAEILPQTAGQTTAQQVSEVQQGMPSGASSSSSNSKTKISSQTAGQTNTEQIVETQQSASTNQTKSTSNLASEKTEATFSGSVGLEKIGQPVVSVKNEIESSPSEATAGGESGHASAGNNEKLDLQASASSSVSSRKNTLSLTNKREADSESYIKINFSSIKDFPVVYVRLNSKSSEYNSKK